jgi:PA14 domain/Fibronectin type III domain/Divergent InlB B-repeat domain
MITLLFAVIFAWDASPTPGVTYRLYYGPVSGQQTIFIDAGTSLSAEVKDLPQGVPIYFVAKAYNSAGESAPSNEVVYAEPVPTPSWQQSKITDLRVVSGTNNSVSLTWTKPSEAIDHIIYWDDDSTLDLKRSDPNPPTSIPYLYTGRTYSFEVRARNSAGVLNQPSNRVTYSPGGAPTPTPTPTAASTPTPSEKFLLTVNNGSPDGRYSPGSEVTVRANSAPSGEEFEVWEGDIAILDDFTSATTQAIIPFQNVAITATYSDSSGSVGTGLVGEYYNNPSDGAYPLDDPFTGSPVLTRIDGVVDFGWGGNSPASQVSSDNFSAKWTGQVRAPVSGSYTFTVTGDDGVRLFLNGQLVIDGWTDHYPTSYSYTTTLTAGSLHNIELHYYEHGGDASCRLRWSYPGQSTQTIPSSQLYPLAR